MPRWFSKVAISRKVTPAALPLIGRGKPFGSVGFLPLQTSTYPEMISSRCPVNRSTTSRWASISNPAAPY